VAKAVRVRVLTGSGTPHDATFSATFTVGTAAGCEVRVDGPAVAPRHVQLVFDGVLWWARDLGSPAGTFLNGTRVQFVPLSENAVLELGQGGPSLAVGTAADRAGSAEAPEAPPDVAPDARSKGASRKGTSAKGAERSAPPPKAASAPAPASRFSSETQIVRALRSGGAPAGRETMMLRRAFERVHKKSARRYQIAVGASLVALVVAGAVVLYQWRKLHTLRATAERLYYAVRTLELQTAKLEEVVLLGADPKQVAELNERRSRLRSMEREYDTFVRELGVYDKLAKDERVILRVARTFGECEVNVPKGFVAEVRRYIERWRSSDRLARILESAPPRPNADRIAQVFTQANLPRQFIYLAAQESGFDQRAIGPPTRYGYAKGMWQFIAPTARRYGLRVGPLHDRGLYDAQDERFDWEKATVAAARYLKDLHDTDAQASGLLAMACYNWGEDNVRGIIQAMPENPQERNFWRLLANRKVPRETYDYVLSIFSVAVICEDPALFGLDLKCPLPPSPQP
jgi:hypothetical protein